MLLTIAIWCVLFLVLTLMGFVGLRLFVEKKEDIGLLHYLLFGFFQLALFSGIWVLFAPLNFWVLIYICIIYCSILILKKDVKGYIGLLNDALAFIINWPLWAKVWLGVLMVIVLNKSAQPLTHLDEGLYYTQTTKWANEWGTVPGLANLHGRFGFNSNWLMMNALFYTPNSNFYLKIGTGLLFLLLACLSISSFLLLKKESNDRATLYSSLLILVSPLFLDHLAHNGADFPLVLFALLLPYFFIKEQNMWAFGLAILIITLKVSSFFWGLGLFILLLTKSRDQLISKSLVLYLIPLLCLLAWLLRNYILSGYLIYPMPLTGFIAPDWQVPFAKVKEESDWVFAWAAFTYNENGILETEGLNWVPNWWMKQKLFDKLILILVLVLPVFRIATTRVKEKLGLIWMDVLVLLGLIMWFFKGPDIRFLWIYALPYLLYLLSSQRFLTYSVMGKIPVLLVLALFSQVFLFRKIDELWRENYRYAVFPAPLPTVEIEETFSLGPNNAVTKPKEIFCWDSPLPCTLEIDTLLSLRGNTLKEGFKIKTKEN